MNLHKGLLGVFAFSCSITANADCSAFPIDVFINGIDPRFNLPYEQAIQHLQTSIDYINQIVGRNVVRIGNNGVPVTFEWNDASAAMATIRQNGEVIKKMQNQITGLKSRMSDMLANQEPVASVNAITQQINQQVYNYNNAIVVQNNIKSQTTNEALGSFSRVTTYAYIKIFGYDSSENLIHVIMHELGHMLGLGHSPGNVMDTRVNGSLELSFADASKIRSDYESSCY